MLTAISHIGVKSALTNKTTRPVKELDAARKGSKIGSTLPTQRIRENIFCDRDDRMMLPKIVKAGERNAVYYCCPECGYTINPLAEKDRKRAIVITTSDGHSLNQERVGPRTLVAAREFKIKKARQSDQDDPTAYDDIRKVLGHGVQITHTKVSKVSKSKSISRILIIQ